MTDRQAKEKFLNFMQIDGRPLVSVDTLDWLIGQGVLCQACCNQASWKSYWRIV